MRLAVQDLDRAAGKTPVTQKLRVAFFVYPTAFQSPGGGEVQLLKTKEYLEREGVEVRLFNQWTDKIGSFDVFHSSWCPALWAGAEDCSTCPWLHATGRWRRREAEPSLDTFGSMKDCLTAVKTARLVGVKTVLSTICWYSWKSVWWTYPDFKGRFLSVSRQVAKSCFPFLPSMRKSMMNCTDILFPNSETEASQLRRYFLIPREKIFVVPNGVDPLFAEAGPGPFVEQYGLRDFILSVGRIEPRKNQLNMIRALSGLDIPVVFIGEAVHAYRRYYEACLKEAGPNVHFLGPIPHDSGILASAYAAANTFLLASWLETPGLAALEAGLAGSKVVITDQGATREYFQDKAVYVQPDRVSEIRTKTLKVYEREKDDGLREHIRRNYLWHHVARRTLEGYQLLRWSIC